MKSRDVIFSAPPPEFMSDEELDAVAAHLSFITAWKSAVESELERRINAGAEFAYAHLVPKNAIRRWDDPEGMVDLFAYLDMDLEEFAPRQPLSPAQLEKKLPRSEFIGFGNHIVKESSGLRLHLGKLKKPVH